MIGPIAPGDTVTTIANFAGATITAAGVALVDSSGGTVVAHTTSGIATLGGSTRAATITIPDLTANGFYVALWDTGGASPQYAPDETIWVLANASGGNILSGDDNGTLSGLTFFIKRNDTLPYIRRQLLNSAGNAITLGTADTVMFTMRPSDDLTMAGTARVHAAATLVDGSLGIVEYQWTQADTSTSTYNSQGQNTPYAAEFEVTFADGTIETFPQSSYIQITIPRDLDPGVNP